MHPENVDPNQVMEATQVVDWDAEEEETERSSNSLGHTLQPVGRLHILDGTYGPQKDYPLYVGKNMIGRSPQCSVILPFPSISKMHAEIEISAWNEPAFLQDCGSLNGTRIMRPPKILRTKIKHRLRSKDLILLADLPCQYYRLNSPLPLVPRGPLTIEETPRAEGGTQPSRLLLAEDSEEEVDTHSKRCMENEPRTTPFPLTTIVPESDEEGLSPAPGVPGPSFLDFDLCSDTDEEEGQPPEAGEASSAAREGVIVKAEPDRMTTGIQRMKTRPAVQRYKDRKVKTDAGSDVIPLRVTRERSHLPGEDSDTDVEEEGSPVTPAIVPGKKRQILRGGFGKKGRRAPGPAFLQERPAHRDTSLDKDKAPLAVPLEKGHSFVVINSDTDEEEEVSTAFALAHLKESEPVLWSIDKAGEEDRAQPQTASERDSDTDMEEELPRGKREAIPTDKDGALVTHSENSQPPLGDSDSGEETDVSSSGIQLNGSQPSTILDNADMEEAVPPGPAVPQMPVTGRSQADVEAELGPAVLPVAPVEEAQTSDEAQETDTEEGLLSAVAGVRKNQCPEAEDLLAWTTAVLEQKSTLEVGAQGISPVAQVEQLVVYTGTPWEHAQPQREGVPTPAGWERKAYVGRSKNSKDSYDDPEKLCLPATQCFVEEESLESVLDAPWEVLATQPFCVSKFEASEPQPVATSFQAHRSHPSSSRVLPHHQHPVHTEPLGTQGRETVEKGMGTQKNPAERATPEMGPLETEAKEWPPDSEKDEKGEEELARRMQVRVVAGDTQCQESDKVKNMSPERVKEGVEVEMPNDIHEKEMERQTLAREVFEREVERPIPGREWKPVELGVNLNREETEGRNHHQKEQTISLVDPGVGKGALEGLASALIVSGSQGDGGKRVPMSPGRQQRGHLNCKMPPAKNASRGGPESSKLHLLHTVPAALAPPQNGLTSQSQKCSAPHPLASPPFPFEPSIPVPHSGSLEAPESLPSSEPNTRPWRCSRAVPPSLSSITSKPHTTSPTDQPATSKRTSQATRGKVNRSSIRTPEPPVTPKPVSQVIRGRTNRSCIRTPEPVVPTGPELQPTSSDQPATPNPISRVPLGRTSRSTIRTSEPVVPIVPELQPTSSDQPATPNPISRVTLGRTSRSTIRTLEPVAPTGPVNPNPISQATRSRTKRSCVKIPEVVTPVPELQLPTYTDQPDTPEPRSRTTRGRAHKSSVTTLEPVIPTIPELQPLMSREEPVTSKPISRATRSRTCNSSTVSPESGGQTPPGLEPHASTDQPVIPEVIDQNKTLRSSTPSATPVPILSDLQPPDATAQPAPLEPSNSRRKRAAGKQGSHTAPAGHRPSSATPEPESQSSTNQSPGAPIRADSPGTTHAPLTQNVKAAGSSGFTLGPKPEGSQIRKRPSTTTDSPPPQKRPRRGVSQKTVFPNKDTANRVVKEEDVVVPEPGKRREQAEEASPGRNLRKNRYNRGSSPHKVLFTGVVDTPGEQAVLALGGSLATTVNEASYLVTDRIRRTVKFLCALGRGIPILSLNWLHQSQKAGYFLPPEDFLVTDPVQEKNFSFSLRDALSRAQKRKLLEGYEIHVTAGVQPPPAQMGEIINCCGGTFLSSMPRSYKPRRVVVTCPQDMPRCSLPSRLGLPLVSSEFLLTGVLKQEATPEAFLLSNLQISPPEKSTTQLSSRK